jgi:hypothetical protein
VDQHVHSAKAATIIMVHAELAPLGSTTTDMNTIHIRKAAILVQGVNMLRELGPLDAPAAQTVR